MKQTIARHVFLAGAVLAGASCAAGPTDVEVADPLAPAVESISSDQPVLPIDDGAEASEGADRDPDPTAAPSSTVANSVALAVSAELDADNSLIGQVSVDTVAPGAIELTVAAAGVEPRVLTPETATQREFSVVGLRALTDYTITASTVDGSASDATVLTTGTLPSDALDVSAVQSGESTTDGITFFGISAQPGESSATAKFYGVDGSGEVVWYLDTDEQANRDAVIRDLGGGEVLVFFADSMQRMTLDGTVLQTYDLSAVDGWHHDAVLLEDGGVLALSRENRTVDGDELRGDVIVELDASGSIVWEWSSFDHLDTSRFPGALATAEAQAGGTDWTHANSIFIDESTGEILLSLRSQHWIVNIDHATGDVIWIAGDDDMTAADFGAEFLTLTDGTWTSGQHAATWTDAGELLVYDNRNETNGEADDSRIVAYEIDAGAATATQIVDAVAPKFTRSLGDVDELDNGNFLMTAGGPGSSDTAHLVELDRTGTTVWEATLDERLYRAERISWADIDGAPSSPGDDPGDDDSGDGVTDLTNATLSSTDASCAAYVGEYSSTVTDVSNDTPFEGALTITAGDGTCELNSNQIPNHDISIDADFANDTAEVDGTFVITDQPVANGSVTDLGFTVHAVMLNGVIWEAYPAACFDEGPNELGREAIGCGGNLLDHPWRYDVGSHDNAFRLDAYSAHAQADGLYHYHSTPEALYEIDCTGTAESPVVGFARDGFPIHGPCFTDDSGTIRAAQSSYELQSGVRQDVDGYTTPYAVGNVTSDEYNGQFIGDYRYTAGAGDLDECNGMTVDGQYGYYITGGYPYVLACFTGTPSDTFGAS